MTKRRNPVGRVEMGDTEERREDPECHAICDGTPTLEDPHALLESLWADADVLEFSRKSIPDTNLGVLKEKVIIGEACRVIKESIARLEKLFNTKRS